ncbi:MAG: DUF4384 domain-containing protein [Muribaculaceae bacterium]|nr:DUF4384 domain-containing protein [Muribaculaceae bacterium]
MSARILSAIVAVILAIGNAMAADNKVHSVKGTSTFYAEPSHSLVDAKRFALEQARIAALASEFGTTVTQDVYQRDVVSGRTESTYFNLLNDTEVNGEWIADSGEPEYEIGHDSNGCFVVTCTVKGTARRISNESVDFNAIALRNGNEPRFGDTRFHPDDELKLYVRVPVDGYLLVYLVDDSRTAYSLLPYTNSSDGVIRLRRDHDYVFFDTAKADPAFGVPDELVMTLDGNRPTEANQLYVLFSPEPFNKAVDRSSDGLTPRTLPEADFHKWLAKVRKRDAKMGVKTMVLTIEDNK